MILLRLVSWQYFRKHLLRTALTAAGIVLGVAVFVGMHTANQSVLQAFYKTVDRIAGATQLQITAGEMGFEESVLERVQAMPEVRVAAPVIEATVQTGLPGQGNLMVLAVDMTGDRSLRDYDLDDGDEAVVDDPLVFLAQPDSLIVTREFAARNGLSVGSHIPMQTMAGPKVFTVRGIMRSGGLTTAFGGDLAVMDVYAAQAVFGRGRRFDRIDLAVKEGFSVDEVQRRIEQVLGPGLQVEPPSSRGQQFESLSSVYAMTASITSVFALFIGMFIIYNTFAIAVTQRRSEIGILRALGATRAQIRNLFLIESLITGLFSSVAGVFLGILIAHAMAAQIGQLVSDVYGVKNRVEELAADPRLLALAVLLGVVTSVVAAIIPARAAAAVDPVQALQKGKYQVLSAGENRLRKRVSLATGLAASLCLLFSESRTVFYVGFLLSVLTGLLLTPSLTLWLSRLLRPPLKWFRPVEGVLAADSLIQAPRRTSGAVAALMLSLALVVSLGGMARSSLASILDWLSTSLDPDLFVGTSQTLTDRSLRFPGELTPQIASVDGVERVQPVRTARFLYRGKPVMIVATTIDLLTPKARRKPIAGDQATMYDVAARGQGLIISENLASFENLRLGEIMEIAAPNGVLRLPIVGINLDYSDQKGTILMDRSLFLRYWNDDTVNVFRVYVRPGERVEDVRRRITARFDKERSLFVFTNENLRAYILKVTDQWFGLTYMQIAVAVLVAVLGIVNTLTVSITDRRRELGVLQAVGALRNQVRHTVWMEAVSIGFIGLALGCAVGAAALWYMLEIAHRDLAGIRLDYRYPAAIASSLLPVILGAAFIAAIGPAESAVRGSLVEALEYE